MTKILPTVGPENSSISDLRYLLGDYKIIRLNGSHNTVHWHAEKSRNLKKINKEITVLIDLPGSKPRIKIDKAILINKNEKVIFFYGKPPKKKNIKLIEISNPLPKIKNNKYFLVNDNQYKFNLYKIKKNYILGISSQRFILENRKGLNLPESFYDEELQKKNVLNFISQLYKYGATFDAVGLSYVQSSDLVKIINKKYPTVLIVSKIENSLGVNNAKDIIKCSDAIMIDRGDLSAEIGEERLYEVIEKINFFCKELSKPLIMATQNLLSMKTQSLPTQSEIFAIGYAKKKNIDMLMLSDETAINKYWKRTLKWLNSFLKKDDNYVIIENENFDIWSVVNEQNNSNIVIFTKKGHSFQNLKLKNNNKYFIFSENKKIENRLNFYSNVIFNHCKFSKVNSEYIKKNIKKYSDVIFEKGRSAILVSILFPKKNSRANTLTLLSKHLFTK